MRHDEKRWQHCNHLASPQDLQAAQLAAANLKSNQTLQDLKLIRNQLDSQACKALSEGIAAGHLQKLRINYNKGMGFSDVLG